MPSQSEVGRNPIILTCTIIPGSGLKASHSLIVHDPILHRNLGHRHSAKSYWPSLRVLVLFHRLRLHGNTRGSCKRLTSLLRKNRSEFWARCSSTLTVFRKVDCVLMSIFKADAIIASSISKIRKITLSCDRSRCNKFINWFCCCNFFAPQHCDLSLSCSQNKR